MGPRSLRRPPRGNATCRRRSTTSPPTPTCVLDAPDVLLAFQTVVTAAPIDPEHLGDYLVKATREAELHTSWTDPHADYEGAGQYRTLARELDLDSPTETVRSATADQVGVAPSLGPAPGRRRRDHRDAAARAAAHGAGCPRSLPGGTVRAHVTRRSRQPPAARLGGLDRPGHREHARRPGLGLATRSHRHGAHRARRTPARSARPPPRRVRSRRWLRTARRELRHVRGVRPLRARRCPGHDHGRRDMAVDRRPEWRGRAAGWPLAATSCTTTPPSSSSGTRPTRCGAAQSKASVAQCSSASSAEPFARPFTGPATTFPPGRRAARCSPDRSPERRPAVTGAPASRPSGPGSDPTPLPGPRIDAGRTCTGIAAGTGRRLAQRRSSTNASTTGRGQRCRAIRSS